MKRILIYLVEPSKNASLENLRESLEVVFGTSAELPDLQALLTEADQKRNLLGCC